MKECNGIIYEVRDGKNPLILLHGNGEDMHIYDEFIKYTNRKIIRIDSRMQGLSKGDVITYELMAQDVYNIITNEKIEECDILGFSDGAIISILIALEARVKINNLILISPNLSPKGFKLFTRIGMYFTYLFSKDNKKKLCRLMLKEPNIPSKSLVKINTNTYIIVGSKDCIKRKHFKVINENIKNSKLFTINSNHYIIPNKTIEVLDIIKDIL